MEKFDKGVTSDNQKVSYMRSVIDIAGPISHNGTRYLNVYDRPEEQDQIVRGLIDEMLENIQIGEGLQVEIYRNPLVPEEQEDQIEFDYLYAAVPATLILLFLWAYLCSFFLASTSIVLVVAAYPPSLLIFHGLLLISY